jgi:hypothetical protein
LFILEARESVRLMGAEDLRAGEPENITQLLIELTNGNRAAVDGLLPLIYDELRSLASALA